MKMVMKKLSVVIGGVALAALSQGALAQVAGSQHDLTAAGTGQGQTGNTDQVCVFCHTPHGSDVNAPVPLWNKVLGAPGSYTTYATLATPSFDAAEAPVGSVSLACLSCHDGTQAMDVVLNGPGSGNYNPAGAEVDPVSIGVMTGAPVPMLGTDLTNDHPISMQYGGGGINVGTAPAAGTCGGTTDDGDFTAPCREDINGQPIWWVDGPTGTATVREKTDMLLYTRDEPTVAGGQQPFVECGSCHDPHNSTTGVPGSDVDFMRVSNAASQVCTACHTK